MDSEDEFMSGMSSDDDMLQESDNDDGSADGTFTPMASISSPLVPVMTRFADILLRTNRLRIR